MASADHVIPSAAAAQLTDSYFVLADNQNRTIKAVTPPLHTTYNDLEVVGRWACANQATYNIKAVLTVGDLVRSGGSAAHWAEYNLMRDVFAACDIPMLPVYGNHDGSPTVETMDQTTNATLFHDSVGKDWMDLQPWFVGQRPDIREFASSRAQGMVSPGDPLYIGPDQESRSYWVQIPPLVFISAEWEQGIRWGARNGRPIGTEAANTEGWGLSVAKSFPSRYAVWLTHAGPCHPPHNCDLTPELADPPISILDPWGSGGNYTEWLEMGPPNLFAYLNGHWGRQSDLGGGGSYAQGLRNDGSRWVAGGWDTNSINRHDSGVAGNICDISGVPTPCPENPYTWDGWMQVKRANRQVCFNTVRTFDVDADDDGTSNIEEGAPSDSCYAGELGCTLLAAEFGQSDAYGFPTAGNPECQPPETQDDGASTGCPNVAPEEFCVTITNIPETS